VRGVREAIGRATAAVRAVAHDARAEEAAQYVSGLDAKRNDLLGEGASLFLVLNAGTATESELEIVGGWYPTTERNHADPNSLYTIEVADRDELTGDVMAQADRLKLNGVLCTFTYDPPLKSPRRWVLYGVEMKEGGLK
jgi:hypothetical protein